MKVCPVVWKTLPAKTHLLSSVKSKVKVNYIFFFLFPSGGRKEQKHIPVSIACVLYVFVHTPAAATVITQVLKRVVVFVCCILRCGSKETSVVTVGAQTSSAPTNWSGLDAGWHERHVVSENILPNSCNPVPQVTLGSSFIFSTDWCTHPNSHAALGFHNPRLQRAIGHFTLLRCTWQNVQTLMKHSDNISD